MYPKYIYVIHLLLREIKHKSESYQEKGCAISRNELRKRICEDNPTTTLILNKLQENQIIIKIKKHSNGPNVKKASRYKLIPDIERLFNPEDKKHNKLFTVAEHGKMISKLVENDEKCKIQVEEIRRQQKELYKAGKELKTTLLTKEINKENTMRSTEKKQYFNPIIVQPSANDSEPIQSNIATKKMGGNVSAESHKNQFSILPKPNQPFNTCVVETPIPAIVNRMRDNKSKGSEYLDLLFARKFKIYGKHKKLKGPMIRIELMNMRMREKISDVEFSSLDQQIAGMVENKYNEMLAA